MGQTMTYLGESQKGHLPAKCSVNTAVNLSTEPRMARWMMTGLRKPGFSFSSYQVYF